MSDFGRCLGPGALAALFLVGCQNAPAPLDPPTLHLVNVGGHPVLLGLDGVSEAGTSLELELIEAEDEREVGPSRVTLVPSKPEEIPELRHGTYRATLKVMRTTKDGATETLSSRPTEVTWRKSLNLIDLSNLDMSAPLGVRVLYVVHPVVRKHTVLDSVTRDVLNLAFARCNELEPESSLDNPWEDIEVVRRELHARSEGRVPPALDPQALIVVDYRAPGDRPLHPAQLHVRLYDLSCEEYDYAVKPGPLQLKMRRALIFEEFVELKTDSEGAPRPLTVLHGWREVLQALGASARMATFREVLQKPPNRLQRSGPQSRLLGWIRESLVSEVESNSTRFHGEIEKDILFPDDQLAPLPEAGTDPGVPRK